MVVCLHAKGKFPIPELKKLKSDSDTDNEDKFVYYIQTENKEFDSGKKQRLYWSVAAELLFDKRVKPAGNYLTPIS